ncbi:MAG TPA: tetratricopeptide repeat protein [Spirochaetales bacterium]|nr:tetratricopeptide repeat protein [Spirochaetales bacterium]HOV37556.1 tetratricopeptide repeat protein [Spirochaetales bacterium]
MERSLLSILLGILSVLCVSCSGATTGWLIVQGNYYYSKGDFQRAQLSYLQALEKGKYAEWIHYNLGNVYYTLGEGKAALEEWEKAELTQDRRVMFNVAFNKGLLSLESGNFKEAERLFKRALELDSTHIPAKINLEYTLKKLESSLSGGMSAKSSMKQEAIDEQSDRILDYIRKKEINRWMASNKITPEETAEDW